MSHYAEIKDGVVSRVIVCSDDDQEAQAFLAKLGGQWVKTSYNTQDGIHLQGGTPLRGTYAGPGFRYDAKKDVFLAPKARWYVRLMQWIKGIFTRAIP